MSGDETFEYFFQQSELARIQGRSADQKKIMLNGAKALRKKAKGCHTPEKEELLRQAQRFQDAAAWIPDAPARPAGRTASAQGRGRNAQPAYDEHDTVWIASEKTNVSFDDIAGLQDVKDCIRNQVILPLQHPDIYRRYNRRPGGGVLLYGVPGTGKTMMAKAIATDVNAMFFPVNCSDVVSRYFGDSERNIRNLFSAARQHPASVIFFDEFDALAVRRGGNSTVMNRLVPELLTQMDGFSSGHEGQLLLVLAATNRPWALDTAFLRPPRLTVKIHVRLPDFSARLYLIELALRGIPCSPDVSLMDLAFRTEGYSAADLESLCNNIKDSLIQRSIVTAGNPPIMPQDVRHALSTVRSSVQKEDLEQIIRWEKTQSGSF